MSNGATTAHLQLADIGSGAGKPCRTTQPAPRSQGQPPTHNHRSTLRHTEAKRARNRSHTRAASSTAAQAAKGTGNDGESLEPVATPRSS